MKKILASTIIMLLIIGISISANADSVKDKLVGTWNITSVKSTGEEASFIDVLGETVTGNIVFKENGTFTINSSMSALFDSDQGTYTIDGNSVTLNFGGKTVTTNVDDSSKLTLKYNSYQVVITKLEIVPTPTQSENGNQEQSQDNGEESVKIEKKEENQTSSDKQNKIAQSDKTVSGKILPKTGKNTKILIVIGIGFIVSIMIVIKMKNIEED